MFAVIQLLTALLEYLDLELMKIICISKSYTTIITNAER